MPAAVALRDPRICSRNNELFVIPRMRSILFHKAHPAGLCNGDAVCLV